MLKEPVLWHFIVVYVAVTLFFWVSQPWESEVLVLHDNFTFLKYTYIEEYDLHCSLYRHLATGAEVMSVRSKDTNKVFGIAFRTPPSDSTGVAHILEHSVLCGSDKFRTKEPFVDLLRGSLQTFLNAMTYSDRTVYPVASQNNKDFYNLADVYLDAVFHPRAAHDEYVLKQEGWHYELNAVNESLQYKGVVYNEMKGVYSNAESLMGRYAQQLLFPDVVAYSVDSGGDPRVIPKLTFTTFLEFYKRYYHPANARIWLYGDNDELERLSFIDERLNRAQDARSNSPSSLPQDVRNARHASSIDIQPMKVLDAWHRFPYAAGEDEKNEHYISFNWVVNESPLEEEEMLLTKLLHHLLVGNSASTLVKTLSESGLGTRVLDDGFDFTLQQGTFSIGMAGVAKGNLKRVEKLVMQTLQKLVHSNISDNDVALVTSLDTEAGDHSDIRGEQSFDATNVDDIIVSNIKVISQALSEDAILAGLNVVEFRLRELQSGRPRGLILMLAALQRWNYDLDPVGGFGFQVTIDSLRSDLSKTQLKLRALLNKYLISNNHIVIVEMYPDLNLQQNLEAEEAAQLADVKSRIITNSNQIMRDTSHHLTLGDIVNDTAILRALQKHEDSQDAKNTIPKLLLDDIDATAPNRYETQHSLTPLNVNVEFLKTIIPESNGVFYFDMSFNLHTLSMSEIELLPLFCKLLIDSGTDNGLGRIEVMRQRDAITGGMSADVLIGTQSRSGYTVPQPQDAAIWLVFRTKALVDQVESMLDICELLLLHAKLDDQNRAVEILREKKASMQANIPARGHAYANTRLKSHFSLRSALSEHLTGIESFERTTNLLEKLNTHLTKPMHIMHDSVDTESSEEQKYDDESNDQVTAAGIHHWEEIRRTLKSIQMKILLQAQQIERSHGPQKKYVVGLAGTEHVLKHVTPMVQEFVDRLSIGAKDICARNSLASSSSILRVKDPIINYNNGTFVNSEWISWLKNSFKKNLVSHEAFVVPTQVNYVGMAFRFVAPGLEMHGSALVVNKLLQMGYLWDHVRVAGGAYGGFSVIDKREGIMSMLSYRDPNLCKTFGIYRRVVNYLKDTVFLEQDVQQAIIGTVGDLDQPESSDSVARMALQRFLRGENDSSLDQLRKEILRTTVEDIRLFAKRLEDILETNDAARSDTSYFTAAITSAGTIQGDKIYTCELLLIEDHSSPNDTSLDKQRESIKLTPTVVF